MSNMLFACVPGKGFATGEKMIWMRSQSGTVTVKEIFWRMKPIMPMLQKFSIVYNRE